MLKFRGVLGLIHQNVAVFFTEIPEQAGDLPQKLPCEKDLVIIVHVMVLFHPPGIGIEHRLHLRLSREKCPDFFLVQHPVLRIGNLPGHISHFRF